MLRKLKSKYKRIERYWFWYKILKNDADWDYEYLLIMIDKKLERMIKLHLYEGHSMNNKMYAYQMAKVRGLIRDYRENSSYRNEQEYIDKIFNAMRKNLRNWWD